MDSIVLKIIPILQRMTEMLSQHGYDNWAKGFNEMKGYITESPDETVQEILSLYRGVASLNDIAFGINNTPLYSENIEFDSLRDELRKLCWKYRGVDI